MAVLSLAFYIDKYYIRPLFLCQGGGFLLFELYSFLFSKRELCAILFWRASLNEVIILLDVTLLGTAALMPIPERALTAAVLACAGRSILFDCGEGTQTAARKAGVSLMSADLIALTHYHGDHTFGLPGLLQTLGVQGRTEPLAVSGPAGIQQELSPILQLAGGLPYPVMLIDIPPQGLALHTLHKAWPVEARLACYPTEHRVVSQCYAFTLSRPPAFLPERARALGVPVQCWKNLQHGQPVVFEGRAVQPEEVLGPPRRGLKFVFSGDTVACDGLKTAAQNADLLISEATYGENEQDQTAKEHGHMTFAHAARLASEANVKRLWLAHYSQMIENPEDYIENARQFFPDAVCGQDGMKITLKYDS